MGIFLSLLFTVIAYRAFIVWRSGDYVHSVQSSQEEVSSYNGVNPDTGLPMREDGLTDIAGNMWGTGGDSHTSNFESDMFSDD